MSSHRETERTYDATGDVELPDLTRLEGVESVDAGREQRLDATYFDTATLDLYSRGVTLRRRTGGNDEGWHLKLPVGADTRDEIRLPLSRARHLPPKPLRDLVLALTRGRELLPVAAIRTRRTESAVHGAGRVLAEIADDRVEAARTLPGASPRSLSWREWELELVDGDSDLLAAADDLMAEAGIEVCEANVKLGRVLDDVAPGVDRPKRPRPKKPAARVLHAYLAAQLERVLASDLAVRRREPEGIHDLRVALRRLRTTLATYRCLVDRDVTDPLREEMRWVSHALGSARDAEVVHERLSVLLAEERTALASGPARSLVVDTARADLREARRATDETLRSERYLAVIDSLHQLVSSPPWTQQAARKARKALPPLLAKDLRRLRRRIRAVDQAEDRAERDRRVHEVRKAAKRLRYACEAAGPVLGGEAGRLEDAAQQLQGMLGDHHDTVMIRTRLVEMAAGAAADVAFTLGRLHRAEEGEAERLENAARAAWADID